MTDAAGKRTLQHIHVLLYLLNFIILLYIGGLMVLATARICALGVARSFLDSVQALPGATSASFVAALICYGVLVALSAWMGRIDHPLNVNLRRAFFAAEVLLCFAVMILLHYGYKEVILLAILDQLIHFRIGRAAPAALVGLAALYLIADLGQVRTLVPMVSFEGMLYCFAPSTARILLGVRSVLCSMVLILFLVYAFLLMNLQGENARRMAQLNKELESANQQLLSLGAEREQMAETRERNRLAREIHDTLGHTLTGILAGVDAAMALWQLDPPRARQQLERVSKTARHGLQDVRRSVGALREDDSGASLNDSLLVLAQETQEVAGVSVALQVDAGLAFEPDEEHTVFRVVQESITNSIRHGHAQHIDVAVEWQADGSLRVAVRDDGIGCAEIKRNFGLRHMRERVELLGGTIRFDGSHGFLVEAYLPIRGGN